MDKYVEYCAHDERHRKIKLIIEIEKDYYEMTKYNVEHGQNYKYFEIIANGIPYDENTNNDSIAPNWRFYYNHGYAQAKLDSKKAIESLYPQKEDCGKWIKHEDFNDSIKYGCNKCGNLTNIPSNFCPNCGKRMILTGAEI